jgi:hypothetical protein
MTLSRTYFTVSFYSILNTVAGRPSCINRLRLFQSVHSHLLLVYIHRTYLIHSHPEDEACLVKRNPLNSKFGLHFYLLQIKELSTENN